MVSGPSVVVLIQRGLWTFGGLANHIESFAGTDSRSDVSSPAVLKDSASGLR